jgi:folate-binding protein YgfZ
MSTVAVNGPLAPSREAAGGGGGLFYVNRSERGLLRLTGRERQSFLQGMITNDVLSLQPGQGCYAFMLDATGHVLADMRVICAADHLLLDVEPGMASFVAETLEKYLIMEKCRITDLTGQTGGQLLLAGPRAAEELARLGVTGAETWTEGQNAPLEAMGSSALVAATRLISGPAFTIYLPDANIDAGMYGANEFPDAEEITEAALDVLRIEAGVPRFGVDIDSRSLAPETGQQKRAIHYRKGCYIGQEIVARIDARGHTNRALTGFTLGQGPLPEKETPVAAGERAEAGRITSAAVSPTLGVPIALGYLRQEYREPGTAVTVNGEAGQVAGLPFLP